MPAELDVHLIMDNYATHKTPSALAAAPPRFHVHFTPTCASWLNLVERWFAELTEADPARLVSTAPAGWKPPSATSTTTTWNRNPSSGPSPPTISSTPPPDYATN